MNQQPIALGQRISYGTERPFGLGVDDARRHVYVVGQTGSGKSTLLRNIILQHLIAGHGVALLDPHGDLAEDLLDHFPPSRADDLVYFHPADADFPIGLNPLFDQDEAGIHGREAVLQRLSLRRYVRTVAFAQSGYQPENLTAEEAQLLNLV